MYRVAARRLVPFVAGLRAEVARQLEFMEEHLPPAWFRSVERDREQGVLDQLRYDLWCAERIQAAMSVAQSPTDVFPMEGVVADADDLSASVVFDLATRIVRERVD